MKSLWIVLIALLGTSLAQNVAQSPPSAPLFLPAAGQRFYFDLDTAGGSFSEWRHDDLSSLSALRATVRILRMREDVIWSPAFSLWLQHTEGGKKQQRLALQFFTDHHRTPLATQLIQTESGRQSKPERLNTALGLNESIVVEIDWSVPHAVAIKIGNAEARRVAISWPINSVGVSVSTGEMEVDPIEFGTTSN